MPIPDAFPLGALRRAAVLGAALVLAGCVAGPVSGPMPGPGAGPDAFELANLRPRNTVPSTAPAALVRSFATVCLDGPTDPDRAAAALRARDYVETRRRPGGPVRGFVVDDNRPAVLLGTDGRTCAVAARARTGQAEAIRSLVARRFPAARMLDPARVAPRTEAAWAIPGGMIVLNRVILPGRPSELILLRIRG